MGAARSLEDKVALVAGATRGAGRGIAIELGAAGATVYCSGRSSRTGRAASSVPSPPDPAQPFDLSRRPETVEETAELVTAAGGTGIAVPTDHLDVDAVARLVGRIREEHGRLDVLVNDVWGGDALTEWGKPFWELDLGKGRTLLDRAIHTHLITSRHALPLLLERRSGLVVEITDGDALYYRGNFFYDIAKTTVIRLAFAMSEELREHEVAAVAVTPGFLRSEAMLEHFGVTAETWRDGAKQDPHFLFSETPRFVGRGVAALASDPDVMKKTGGLFSSWQLAAEYGFDDVDGTRPDWGAHARQESFYEQHRASNQRFVTFAGASR
jgi:NAD(P)-dependent dehydrogenase (short-subunit alcohol dehydrogenase family)